MKWFLIIFMILPAFSAVSFGSGKMIDQLESVNINNSKQWILQRGVDREKPVVLFVHGGPGSPLMYFSRAYDDIFINDFVIIHWDQRGSGKSYNPAEPASNYQFQQYLDDGLAVVEYLKSKFQKEKIILVGHSWGTMVAFNMVAQKPNYFESLITVGTVSRMLEMEEYRYKRVRETIEKSGNAEAIKQLLDLGPPPFLNFESLMAFGNLLAEFVGFDGTFRKLTMEQLNEAVAKNKEYSEAEMTASLDGMKVVFNELAEYLYRYDALNVVPEVDVPVYFIQGRYDFNTPTHLARNYYEEISAKRGKYWIEFDASAHFPFYEEPENFLNVLRRATAN